MNYVQIVFIYLYEELKFQSGEEMSENKTIIEKFADAKNFTLQTPRQDNFFEKFINSQIQLSTPIVQNLPDEQGAQNIKKIYNLQTGELRLATIQNPDGSILTTEYCQIPFPHIQSETTSYPDGSKKIVTFYPTAKKPAKKVELSADGAFSVTTTYDRNGQEKNVIKMHKNPDGSGAEENTDMKFGRTNMRYFDKFKTTRRIESYINGKITFRLVCDEFGNIQQESNYYTFFTEQQGLLQKETIYNEDGSYTLKEYTLNGRVSSCETIPAVKNQRFLAS